MGYNLNFENRSMFKYRFKRDPKIWKISEVHDLWIKAKLRSSKRQNSFSEYLNWIVLNTKSNDSNFGRKNWKIFYSSERYFLIHVDKVYGLSYSMDRIELKDRNSKIDSIINVEETIEMGKKLKLLHNMISNLDYKVKIHLDRLICNKVSSSRDVFRSNDESKFIRISGKTYLYKLERNSRIECEIMEDKIIEFV